MYRGDFVDLSYQELCQACARHLNDFRIVPPFNTRQGQYNLIDDMAIAARARDIAVDKYDQNQRNAIHNLHAYFTALQGTHTYQSYDDAIKENAAISALQGILPIQDIIDDAGVTHYAAKTRKEYGALQAGGFYAVREAQGDGSCYMNALLQSHIENTIVGLQGNDRKEVFMHMADLLRKNLKENSRFLQDGRDPKEIEYLMSRFESAANGICWPNVQEFRRDFSGKMPRERNIDPDGAWLMQRAFRYVWAQHLLDNPKKEVVVRHPDANFEMRYAYDKLYCRAGYGKKEQTLEGYVNFLTKDGDLIEGSDAILPTLLGCHVELKQKHEWQGDQTETITAKWPEAVAESRLTQALDKLPKITILRSGVHYKSLLTQQTYLELRQHELRQMPVNALFDVTPQQVQENGYSRWEKEVLRIPPVARIRSVAPSPVVKSQRAVEDDFRILANSANGNMERLIRYIDEHPSLYSSNMSIDYLVEKFMDINDGKQEFARYIQQIDTNARKQGFNDFCPGLLRTLDELGYESLQDAKGRRMRLPSYERAAAEQLPPTTFLSSDAVEEAFRVLVDKHPRDLPAMINYLSNYPGLYHKAESMHAVVSAFYESDYSPEQFADHMLQINKQASKHAASQFASQLLSCLHDLKYEPCLEALQLRSGILLPLFMPQMLRNDEHSESNLDEEDYLERDPEQQDEEYEEEHKEEQLSCPHNDPISKGSVFSDYSNRYAAESFDVYAHINAQEKERNLQEIKNDISDGLKESAQELEERNKYTIEQDLSEQKMKVSYQTSLETIIPVLEVKSASVKVFKSWRRYVNDQDVSLSTKALIVLKSLGIPPCPPENIYITNEATSLLGKEIRKQYNILEQTPDIVVSIRRSSTPGDY
jgi:hypothetical protein